MNINCDMGEGLQNEALIIPYINSANISCGLHAGDVKTIRETIVLAKKYRVSAGAHPSFDDRENFGRMEMELTTRELYELLTWQLKSISDIAADLGEQISHVKPHGALYNLSARHQLTAAVIATAVRDFNPLLTLFGLSGSFSIKEGKAAGLKTSEEGFADRRYNPDGSLVSRADPRAMITDVEEAVAQTLSLGSGKVRAVNGEIIYLHIDTICIHGDGINADVFAKAIHEALQDS